jgi:hypothetical protein
MNRRAHVVLTFTLALAGIGLTAQSNAQTYGRVEQTDAAIVYEGSWQTIAEPSASGGSMAVSNQTGASATLTFTGTGAGWIGYQCPCAGIARIYLDGVEQTPRDMYTVYHNAQAIGTHPYGLNTSVPHTLKIVVSGERNSASTGTYVAIDAFNIGPLDSNEPSVDITSPAYGSVVSGMVTINATASDDRGVAFVAFYADEHFIGQDRAPPYSVTVDASRVPHGSTHTIRAVASDSYSGSPPSLVQVTVDSGGAADVYPPVVQMTAPANDAVVTGVVTISASASDNVGVTKVQFLANGGVIGEDSSAPYAITRDTTNLPSGSQYTVSARAFDAAGRVSIDSSVNVTVQH